MATPAAGRPCLCIIGGRRRPEEEERERDKVGPARQPEEKVNPGPRVSLSGSVFPLIRFPLIKAYPAAALAQNPFSVIESVTRRMRFQLSRRPKPLYCGRSFVKGRSEQVFACFSA
jgi:hypothetical protein